MRYYLTTAIPYVNAKPHLGFVLEIVQTDTFARFLKLLGEEVYWITGTDENSLKNVIAARKLNISVQELVDKNSIAFRNLREVFHLSYNDFIRTTEERHRRGVKKLWEAVATRGDIYKKDYQGLYCVGCEAFYKPEELVNGLCPEHKTKPELVKEENYFFKLSRYQKKLEEIIEKGKVEIVPVSRRNEIVSFIHQGLEDFSISRSMKRASGWGIPVPGDNSQVIYVWFDALANYITALGYAENSDLFRKWWEKSDKIIHFIGKGITRFHAVYWPAMLLSAGIRLPSTIFVHGYLTINGQKISKSSGGAIDPLELVKEYDPEVIRYFLLREISPGEDGDFSKQRLQERYNSDLAQGLGNLVSRILSLGEQYGGQIIVNNRDSSFVAQSWDKYKQLMMSFRFNEAVAVANELVAYCDKYISESRPWEKKDTEEFPMILGRLVYILGIITLMLLPVIPHTAEKILRLLQLEERSPERWLNQKIALKRSAPLFPKI